jgi:putative hydrolase of the HAD superfamily
MNLVFDFGAVLFDWQPSQLVAAHFPDLAATPQAAQQLARSVFYHDDWHAFDCGKVALETVVARTSTRLALPLSQVHELVSGIGERLRPIKETVGVLGELNQRRHLRGDVHLYFLSNMPAPYARTLQQKYPFLAWFEGGIFSGDVQCSKPDPAIFRLLQTRYELDPAQTIFIDDSQENVDVACGLGWHGLHFVSAQLLRAGLANLLGS